MKALLLNTMLGFGLGRFGSIWVAAKDTLYSI